MKENVSFLRKWCSELKFIAKELFPYNFRLRKCREEDKVPLTN